MFDSRHKLRRLEAAARQAGDADFLAAATRAGLLERLDGLRIDAGTVLDLGAAAGAATRELSRRFGRPQILSVDLADGMLRRAASSKPWRARAACIRADAAALPFADASIDVVFANLLLPWIDDPAPVLAEVGRVLKKDGLFAFATLGPDSLAELAAAWAAVDDHAHVRPFPDMHDLGDGLLRAGLGDPVLDVDRINIDYPDARKLYADLTAAGARNSLAGRRPGLTSPGCLRAFEDRLRNAAAGDRIRLQLELVFGHAWGRGQPAGPGSFSIDATGIPLRRRN